MGFLYDSTQGIVGNPGLQKGTIEFWIDWRRSATISGEESDDTKAKIITLCVDSTISVDRGTDMPLETYFRSLAYERLPPIRWRNV